MIQESASDRRETSPPLLTEKGEHRGSLFNAPPETAAKHERASADVTGAVSFNIFQQTVPFHTPT